MLERREISGNFAREKKSHDKRELREKTTNVLSKSSDLGPNPASVDRTPGKATA